jgi:hypothetical protein
MSSRPGSGRWSVRGELTAVAHQGPQRVDEPAGER